MPILPSSPSPKHSPLASEYIYETIDLPIEETTTITRLSKIHAANPTLLAEYPKTLNIFSNLAGSKLLDSPLLGTIISYMQNLRTISLTDCNVEGKPFVDVFAAPSMGNITSLELRAVQLTFHEFSIFLGSPHLTHLKLAELVIAEYADPAANGEDGVDFSSPDCNLPQPQSALNRPVQDLRLDINTTSDVVVMDLVATSRYSIIAKDSLAKVTFSSEYAEDEHVYRFQRFLDCDAVKSAQRIHLGDHDKYFFTDSDSSEFDPLKFDTFKAVELRFGINPGDWQFPSEFQWWANSLSAVRVGAPLKELHLIITFQSHLNVNDLPEVAMPGWCNFDAALCGRNLALNYLAISIAAVQTLNAQEKSIVERWFFAWVPGIYEKYFAEGRGETAHLDVSSVLGGVYGTNDAVYRGDIHMY